MSKGIETMPEAIDQICRNPILPPWRKKKGRTTVFDEGNPEGANVPEAKGERGHEVEADGVLPLLDRVSMIRIAVNAETQSPKKTRWRFPNRALRMCQLGSFDQSQSDRGIVIMDMMVTSDVLENADCKATIMMITETTARAREAELNVPRAWRRQGHTPSTTIDG